MKVSTVVSGGVQKAKCELFSSVPILGHKEDKVNAERR